MKVAICMCRHLYRRHDQTPLTPATEAIAALTGAMCLIDLIDDMHCHRSGQRLGLQFRQWLSHPFLSLRALFIPLASLLFCFPSLFIVILEHFRFDLVFEHVLQSLHHLKTHDACRFALHGFIRCFVSRLHCIRAVMLTVWSSF